MNPELELKKLGFSEKEAKVYIALLELGQSSAAEIAKRSGVNRATTYVILDEICKKGLISTFEKGQSKGRSGKKTFYVAERPEQLKVMLQSQEAQIKSGLSSLASFLPELKQLYEAHGERPKVRFFDGKGSIEAIREDILNTDTPYYYEMFNMEEAYRFFPPQPADHRKKMTKKFKSIDSRSIYTLHNKKIQKMEPRIGKWERKFIPDLNFQTEIILYANKSAFFNYKDDVYAVLIEDKGINQILRTIFELLWEKY